MKKVCSECGKQIGLNRMKTKKGWMCPECFKATNAKPPSGCVIGAIISILIIFFAIGNCAKSENENKKTEAKAEVAANALVKNQIESALLPILKEHCISLEGKDLIESVEVSSFSPLSLSLYIYLFPEIDAGSPAPRGCAYKACVESFTSLAKEQGFKGLVRVRVRSKSSAGTFNFGQGDFDPVKGIVDGFSWQEGK